MTPGGPSAQGIVTALAPGGSLAGAGIGLRGPHIAEILEHAPGIPWLELLADNHLHPAGPERALTAVLERYPAAIHCVAMNLGGVAPLDRDYLRALGRLAQRCSAPWVSEHLCFTAVGPRHHHDLLPLPWTEEALDHVAERVSRAQDWLGRPLLVENVSAYLGYRHSTLSEPEFLTALVATTGCGLLVDVNNLYVNQANLGIDARAWLAAIPAAAVREAHLAGHEARDGLLVDTHGARVADPVWDLYREFCRRFPGVPVLIERDNAIPPLDELLAEAARAQAILDGTGSRSHGA